jgi:hypothetical protein
MVDRLVQYGELLWCASVLVLLQAEKRVLIDYLLIGYRDPIVPWVNYYYVHKVHIMVANMHRSELCLMKG